MTASPKPIDNVAGLRTGSVRRHVALGVIAVLAAVLILLSVAINGVYSVQSERNLNALLSGRAQLARQLARSGVGPQQIINRVTANGVQAELTLRSGRSFASSTTPDLAAPDIRSQKVTLRGPGRINNARLVLAVDTSLVQGARQTLRRLLVVAGLAALLVSAVLVLIMVRLALRPLDAVAGLAHSITAGNRGARLRPTRPDTEIGQTAQALDAMLDELEGAESRARSAEAQSQQFLADAAHELRTPIAGVQAAAETLLHQSERLGTEERQRLEALLAGEARRAGLVVSDLLEAVRLESRPDLRPVPTDLRELATTEIERISMRAPSVTVTLDGPSVVAICDPDRIAAVLRNLLDNALRAAGDDGRITVRVAAPPDPGADSAVIDVVDSGPGVPGQDRERIFDRMVRLDADRSAGSGGSGLGLAIARGWARAHGGDLVCLEPANGRGALFRLTLPMVAVPIT
ncbi:two-component sensor histidine kinase [Microlunatus endophyticus]|uniref:histidine kinase n=1 Tax=Microlunatus endophyticus TaxID=1716077 RepID=A0A917SFB8_9ACTN|nr:HAMP domain-containing sensor histidine kinase [Microlunatus endophyticus]GGL77664.1 two-component sensor histidine kinase [Microlunatus endophyticus]